MHDQASKIQLRRLKRHLQRFLPLTYTEVSTEDVYYLSYRNLLEGGMPKLFVAAFLNSNGVRLTFHAKDLETMMALPRFAAIKHYYTAEGILQFITLPRELDYVIIALLKELYILNHPNMNRIVSLPSNNPLSGTPIAKNRIKKEG